MNINSQAPDFRLPCFLKGSLQYVPLRDFQGHPIILCCLYTIEEEQDAWALEAHATELVKSGWTLALLLSHPLPHSGSWSRPLQEFDLAIFTDPLKRFCRALNLFHHFQSRRCETLIFDHQIHLQFRLIPMISTGKDYHPFWKSQKAICCIMYPFRTFITPYPLIIVFPSPPNSETRIDPG